MSDSKKNTFFGGAAILMVSAIAVKLIGAIYKIPLTNVLGAVGYGHFTNAYAIFGLLLTLATAGLPVALSQSIAHASTLGRRNQLQKTFRVASWAFLFMGVLGAAVLYFGAEGLAAWQGDTGAASAIRALSPSVLLVCLMSTFRGYAQGHGDMTPTSISQIIESACKVVAGLFLGTWVMTLPFQSEELRMEAGAAGAILGVSIGAIIGLVYLTVLYFRKKHKAPAATADIPDSTGAILKNLLKVAVPITLGSSVMAIVNLIDTNLVQNLLQDALGLSQNVAVGLYGTYQAANNLYNLPGALMIPFTAAAIPAITAALTAKNPLGASRISESAIRVAALIAFPAGIGLTVLAEPIMSLLYGRSDIDLMVGGNLLALLGVSSAFVCIMAICNSVLQAYGFVNLPIGIAAVGGVIKLVVNYFLVSNPAFGIYGAPIGTLCCFGVVAILDVIAICKVVPAPPNFFRAFAKPFFASLLMGGVVYFTHALLVGFLPGKLATIGGICVGGVVYLVLIVVLRVFSKEDLALMPKGDKLAKLLKL
ncbi:MAG: polysaccharide biosynthesis protein [Oscillospiraceae bacterium]